MLLSTLVVAVVAVVAACGSSTDEPVAATRSDGDEPEADASSIADKTFVDIGGRKVYVDCEGEGSPTVVIEAGLGDVGRSWVEVQQEVASTTRVCWISRAGLGISDRVAADEVRTAQDATDDLAAVLAAGPLEPPYVMVGHSFGGYIERLFADQRREDVAGMVLVDSSHEDTFAAIERRMSPAPWQEIERVVVEIGAENAENMDIEASASEVAAVGALGDLPLVALSAGDLEGFDGWPVSPEAIEELNTVFPSVWQELQRDLAAQSTRGELRTIDGAGHIIHVDNPAAVIDAIKAVVSSAR